MVYRDNVWRSGSAGLDKARVVQQHESELFSEWECSMPYDVTIVPTVHSEQAEYTPFEESRMRLVRLIDHLVHTLETDSDFRCFALDGQAALLEDYLEIRPDQRPTVSRFVREGRLAVGPWYVVANEFLSSGESLVRNLILGHRISNGLGAAMKVGYVPGTFGHIGQLPLILRGFGIDNVILSGGVDPQKAEKLRSEFLWESPHGTSVLALWLRALCIDTASADSPSGWDDDPGVDRIRRVLEAVSPHTLTDCLLLDDGVGLTDGQPDLPETVRLARAEFPDIRIQIGLFEKHVDNVKRNLRGKHLQTIRGELNHNYSSSLNGTFSSRIHLKQINARCQTLLETYAEPLCAVAWLAQAQEYQAGFLWYAWKTLLRNHRHNAIGGCSVDQVHRNAEHRFSTVDQVGNLLVRDALQSIARRMDLDSGQRVPLLVYNPVGCSRTDAVRATIPLVSGQEPTGNFVIRDENGREIPYLVAGRSRTQTVDAGRSRGVVAVELMFPAADIPPVGYRTYYLERGRPSKKVPGRTTAKVTTRRFENSHYRLRICNDGTLEVTHRKKRKVYRKLLTFENSGDAGDEFNWSPVAKDRPVTSAGRRARVKLLLHNGEMAIYRIETSLTVPVSLNAKRQGRVSHKVTLPIVTEVTCCATSPRIDCVTTVSNKVRDHRLRVLFPTGIRTNHTYADGHFDVVHRTVALPPALDGHHPYAAQHQCMFTDVHDGKKGLAVINKGLPEYEVIDEGTSGCTIALTLLRCVGWLSRDDLASRPHNAGPQVETPEAQCQGTHRFEYAILCHDGSWDKGDVMYQARQFNAPLLLVRAQSSERKGADAPAARAACNPADPQNDSTNMQEEMLPSGALSFLNVAPTETFMLSAVKKADSRDALVLRFYNPTSRSSTARVRCFRPIRKANILNLNEEIVRAISVGKDGTVRVKCRGHTVATVELYL